MTKKIYLFLIFAFLTPLTGCYTTNQNEISNYERFGSNTYSVFNVDASYLKQEDSKCVTRSESIAIDDEIKNKTTTECVEVNNLYSDRGKMFSNLIDSFFNSGSGMMFISGMLDLL